MEQHIKDRFSCDILSKALSCYGATPEEAVELDGFESNIHEFKCDGQDAILRLSHSLRRNKNLILGEIDWIGYLFRGGASVATAIPSRRGNLVEIIEDAQGDFFLATAFTKVDGQPPRRVGWTPELYERYGREIGKMHALTKLYQLPNQAWKRPEWDDPIMQDVERHLPPSESIAAQNFRDLIDYARRLPKDRDSYGLIHYDAHGANMLIDSTGNPVFFDFDDCAYCWFVYDIAIVLFYMVMGAPDPVSFTEFFLTHFLCGYRQANALDPGWLNEIPMFLKTREIDMYAIIHRSFDVDNLDDRWCERFMNSRKFNIENNVPYIDFDFSTLATLLEK